MNSPDQVRIKIEVDVPLGAQAQRLPAPAPVTRLVAESCPARNADHFVRPVAGMGVGAICAWVKLDGGVRDQVKAIVYPQVVAHQDADPPGSAVAGAQNTGDPKRWDWVAGANELRGADHLAGGAPNVLYVWSKTGTNAWVAEDTIPFKGVDAAPGTDCCSNGGGSGSSGSSDSAATPSPVFPALWCVELAGDVHGALRVFAARWTLRAAAEKEPAWDNGGDGEAVARVRLTLEGRARWALTLAWQGACLEYELPYAPETSLGPLRFAGRDADVGPLGRVPLPAVVVAAP